MEPTAEELECLVARYWLHYYPELTGKKWTSEQVKSTATIILNFLLDIERRLYEAGLLSLPKYEIIDRTYNQPHYKHFEWRLEVSGYGASVVEPLCAMDLMLMLGEIFKSMGNSPLSARQRIAIMCRPRDYIVARVMRHIPKPNLPELLSHEHEFIRGAAEQRLVDTPDQGACIYQYRPDGPGAGSFRGPMLPS